MRVSEDVFYLLTPVSSRTLSLRFILHPWSSHRSSLSKHTGGSRATMASRSRSQCVHSLLAHCACLVLLKPDMCYFSLQVYVQQPQNKGGRGGPGAGAGCCACLAGACLCCCAEEVRLPDEQFERFFVSAGRQAGRLTLSSLVFCFADVSRLHVLEPARVDGSRAKLLCI